MRWLPWIPLIAFWSISAAILVPLLLSLVGLSIYGLVVVWGTIL